MAELSVHFERHACPAWQAFVESDNEYAVLVNPPSENPALGKKIIGRIADDDEQAFIAGGAEGARAWWTKNYHRVALCAAYLFAVVSCNEPNPPDGDWTIADAYMHEWTLLSKKHFPLLPVINGNFYAGGPEPEDMKYLNSCLMVADFWAFHEYWMEEHYSNQYAAWDTWLFNRHKRLIDALPPQVQRKPVFITEAGCDMLTGATLGKMPERGGWRRDYGGDWPKYFGHLKHYADNVADYVVSVMAYEAGPWDEWKSYELDANHVTDLCAYNLAPPLPLDDEGTPLIRVGFPDGHVETMDLDEYLKGVVPCEVYTNWPEAVLDAQAIAARSYALASLNTNKHGADGYDVCTKQCCQVYDSSRRSAATDEAVERTRGVVGVDADSRKVRAMYFSSACGGETLDGWGSWLVARTDCPCQEHGKKTSGHQHGMCQWGAKYLADMGWTSGQILDFYYKLDYATDYGQGFNLPHDAPIGLPSQSLEAEVLALKEKVAKLETGYASLFSKSHANEITCDRYGELLLAVHAHVEDLKYDGFF